MICDSIITFIVGDNKGYVPSQEPVDLMETSYENGGGCEIGNVSEIRTLVKQYNLSNLLIGN
jgi:hypothetical protein